jgi:anti-sigma B factor antagonist
MTIRMRTVRVHQVPEKVTTFEERCFLRKLQNDVDVERPRFVLDCSMVRSVNMATLRLLLSCLEVAMKRNGDVRLASLPAGATESLRFAGVHRLFEMFPTTAEAVQSFHQRPASVLPLPTESEEFDTDAKYAA